MPAGKEPEIETTLVLLVILGVAMWAWRDAMRAREHAVAACRSECRRRDFQLLDDTVALARLRVVWSPRLALRRTYVYELSVDGTTRHDGTITLHGDRIESIHVPEPVRAGPERRDLT